MKKLEKMLLTVVFVLGIFGIFCRDAGADLSQNFDLQGIHLNASAGDYKETAYANVWGHLQQGINGRYYQYEYSNMSFNTFEPDPSEFYLNASWNFAIVGKENYIPDFGINASQRSNVNAFGVSLWMNSNIRNDVKWMEDPGPPTEWYPIITDDIVFSLYFSLTPARIESIGLQVNEWKWKEDPVLHTLWMSFSGQGYFVGDNADALGSMFMNPEPATVAILGLGGLALVRRKK